MPEYRHHLRRLRFLAGSQDGTAFSRDVAAEIRNVTNAVIAEAEAMSRATLRDRNPREPQADTFLWVRVTRLAAAADRAVNAALSGDLGSLRAHLRNFETLTSAVWTVRDAVYDPEPVHT
jgi:hypothetical protein